MAKKKANMVDKQCKETGWQTPRRILDCVDRYAWEATGKGIALDPATTPENPVGASLFFARPRHDGLNECWSTWADHGVVFLNPPYGKKDPPHNAGFPAWVEKVGEETREYATHLVCLFAAQRFETEYYQRHVLQPALTSILFVRKRLAFLRSDGKPYAGNPYGSVVLLFNGVASHFRDAFKDEGVVIQPMF